MSDPRPRWSAVAEYFGLLPPGRGRPRTRLVRVLSVADDSTRAEAMVGVVLQIVLLALVLGRVFADPVWFRWVAGFASVVLFIGLVRTLVALARR